MHSDLSPHLHSEECNKLINQLRECHETNKFGKFIGYCNDIDRLLVKCLRREREERQRANLEKSRAKQAKYKEMFEMK